MLDGPVIGTLGDLASVPGMPSENTLRKLIRDNVDFPVVSAGRNGVGYEIDIAAAVEWLRTHNEKREAADRARTEQVQQFAMELLGTDAATGPAEAGLSASERRQLLEEELVAIKVAERRGQLIRKDSVEEAIGAVLVMDARLRAGFSARLAKRIELPRDVIAAIDSLMEFDRKTFSAEMGKIVELSDVDAEAGADPAL